MGCHHFVEAQKPPNTITVNAQNVRRKVIFPKFVTKLYVVPKKSNGGINVKMERAVLRRLN